MALQERVRRTGNQRAIDLARRDHLAQRLIVDTRELHPLWKIKFDFLDAAGLVGACLVPVDVAEPDAVLVIEPAAHIDRGRMGPFGRADRFTLEIGRCFDLAPLIHVEGRESKEARTDDWQADNVGCFPRHLRAELRKRQLAHLPLAIEGKAREHFMVSEHKPGVVDALGIDDTEAEVSEMIIVGGSDGEFEARHSSPLCNLAPGLRRAGIHSRWRARLDAKPRFNHGWTHP